MNKVVLNNVVSSYNNGLIARKRAIKAIEGALKVFYSDGSESVGEFSQQELDAMRMSLYQSVDQLRAERDQYVCPRCDAPLTTWYEGSSLGNEELFLIKACSRKCDFSVKEKREKDVN